MFKVQTLVTSHPDILRICSIVCNVLCSHVVLPLRDAKHIFLLFEFLLESAGRESSLEESFLEWEPVSAVAGRRDSESSNSQVLEPGHTGQQTCFLHLTWSVSTHSTHYYYYIILQVIRLLLMLFLQSVQSALQCDYSHNHLQHNNITALKYQLQSQMRGMVVAPWDDKYEVFRKIHNAACCQKPLLIARPLSQKVESYFKISFYVLDCNANARCIQFEPF